jgi:hypothetical protein
LKLVNFGAFLREAFYEKCWPSWSHDTTSFPEHLFLTLVILCLIFNFLGVLPLAPQVIQSAY